MNIVASRQPLRAQRLSWLLAAQFLAVAALINILPIWSVALWLVCATWCWQCTTKDRKRPGRLLKALLVILASSGLYLSFRGSLTVEATVSILVVAASLKLLELATSRDRWVLIFINYFIIACGFLFRQEITALPIAAFQVLVLISAQQRMYRNAEHGRDALRSSAIIAAQALPLMLLIFLIFPRIGPLWSMPLPRQSAFTGMSDTVRFGDIAQLSQSGERAFRVEFEGGAPSVENLYWRGLVLEKFDGETWRRALWRGNKVAPYQNIAAGLGYTITLEPGVHRWLYSLPVSSISRDDVFQDYAYQWHPKKPLTGRLRYRAVSNQTTTLEERQASVVERNLYLPRIGNNKAKGLAASWRQQYADPEDRIAAALRYFGEQEFVYTLSPPLLEDDTVDGFLFGTRQGFCEHFAASFSFLMRAAGVPSRLVVGYQGGEYNSGDGYLLVNQSDAHAWSEVWLEGEGWRRIDPTAAVAPNRIRLGAENLFRNDAGFLSQSPFSLRRFAWATQLRHYMDSINYAWARWVLNYDTETQLGVLQNLLGELNIPRLLLLVGFVVSAFLALVAALTLRREKVNVDAASKAYQACCKALKKRGLERREGETPEQFCQRVCEQQPQYELWIQEVTGLYRQLYYQTVDEQSYKELLARLKAKRRVV